MLKRVLILMAVLLGFGLGVFTPAIGAERNLSGDEITALLPKIAARGNNTYQIFDENGATDYSSGGRESKGIWEVRENQYCSLWPPSKIWACYQVAIDEDKKLIFWIGRDGNKEQNRFEFKN